jgi:hypothetical protein
MSYTAGSDLLVLAVGGVYADARPTPVSLCTATGRSHAAGKQGQVHALQPAHAHYQLLCCAFPVYAKAWCVTLVLP